MTLPSPDRNTMPTGVIDVAELRSELEGDDVDFDGGFFEDDFGTLETDRPTRRRRSRGGDPVGVALIGAMLLLFGTSGAVLIGVLGLLAVSS